MNSIVDASLKTLGQSKSILHRLSGEELCYSNIPPYNSSVGSHIRHILDFYNCVFAGLDTLKVDLTRRNRDSLIERDCDLALREVENVEEQLNQLRELDAGMKIMVEDDLGLGTQEIEYTLGALLTQANSHTIHHYAIINYLLDRLGISATDQGLGFNPSTPRPSLLTGE